MDYSLVDSQALMLLQAPALLQGENADASANSAGDGAAPAAEAKTAEAKTGDAAKTESKEAADGSTGGKPKENKTQGQSSGGIGEFFPLILIGGLFLFMIMFSGRSRKKQQAKFESLYDSLKRDDEIMLTSGKFVYVDKVEKDRIVVFADKARNIRETYHRNAVANKASEVGGDDTKGPSDTVSSDVDGANNN